VYGEADTIIHRAGSSTEYRAPEKSVAHSTLGDFSQSLPQRALRQAEPSHWQAKGA